MAPDVIFPHLGITIQNLSRVAFTVFGVNVYWYGITMVLGVILGTLVACVRAKRSGQKYELYLDFLFFAIIGCVICARLYYVAFDWGNFRGDLGSVFSLRQGGLAIYGAVIGAFIVAVIFTRVKKLDFWTFADTAIPGLILGQAIGRWGNFVNREAYGGFTNSLFAMQYKVTADMNLSILNDPNSIMSHVISMNGAEYIQVHPTFLYESVWNLLVFIGLLLFTRHKKVKGEVVFLYFIGYGVGRFFIEGLRTDQLRIGSTGIPVSQLLSAVLVVAALFLFIWRRRKHDQNLKNGGPKDPGGEHKDLGEWLKDSHENDVPQVEENAEA